MFRMAEVKECIDEPLAKQLKLDPTLTSANKEKSTDVTGELTATDITVNEFATDETDTPEHLEVLLKENDVGISEYISTLPATGGIIKQRYSDFLVSEISLDGQTVSLTSTDLPADGQTVSLTSTDLPADTQPENTSSQTTSIEEIRVKEIPSDILDQLPALLSGTTKELIFPVSDDKEQRKAVHEFFKKHYPTLSSTTTEHEAKKCIKIVLAKNETRQNRKRRLESSNKTQFCHCVLYKENKDTFQTINLIAKFLRIPANRITYVGTKDKRAKTLQKICVQRVRAESLQKLNNILRNIRLGNFSYESSPLQLGQHKGNKFNVVLRNVTADDSTIAASVASLQAAGFINYFGMQRFGSTSVPTHAVGRALLKQDWKEAIELLMKPRGGDSPKLAEARRIWMETRDASEALKCLGRDTSVERHLLVGLEKCAQNDLVTAIGHIPRNQRLMYIHAFQSFMWNKIVSERIRRHRLDVLEGDLVQPSSTSVPEFVTPENVSKLSIHDVVLPLPGYDIKLPSNTLKEVYEDIMQEEGFTWQDFKPNVRDYWLPGSYRYMIVKPDQVVYRVRQYDDVSESIVLSDYEKLMGETLPEPRQEGKFKALQIEFCLPSSTYATMALRELIKSDTSAAEQTRLNTL